MNPKDSKKTKFTSNSNSYLTTKSKKVENNDVSINKLLTKNKMSKAPIDNNTHNQKYQESKFNKYNKNLNNDIKTKAKEIEKKKKSNLTKYQTKTNNEKVDTKNETLNKPKTPNKLTTIDKTHPKSKNISKKNSVVLERRKSPFSRTKSNYINDKKKKVINNENKTKERNKNENETKKLFQFLVGLTPVDSSKCNELINKNLYKIIELENKVKDIVIQTQDEIEHINKKGNNNLNDNEKNKITLEQNIEIINKESKMRKDIYKLLFNYITEVLEQINKLSYNIANHELKELNNISSKEDLFLMINNNGSLESNNSLFASEIQEELCGRLINITKSFINSEIDLSEINFKGDINFNNLGKKYDDNLFVDDDDDIEDYKNLLKNKSKRTIHPNEILDKAKNNDKKDPNVIRHHSNHLKVNSNLEKLEEKVNNDEDNINIEQFGNIKNLMQGNNCFIF